MIIDAALPTFDAVHREHRVVEAEPQIAWRAIRALDFRDVRSPLTDLLVAVRGAPDRLARLLGRRRAAEEPTRLTFDDMAAGGDWVLLGEHPGEEIAFGVVGRFWRPTLTWRQVPAADFAAFAEPGWGKIAAGLSVRSYGPARSLVSYEARTALTDPESRRSFLRYWRLVDPFVGAVMRAALASVAEESEALELAAPDLLAPALDDADQLVPPVNRGGVG